MKEEIKEEIKPSNTLLNFFIKAENRPKKEERPKINPYLTI